MAHDPAGPWYAHRHHMTVHATPFPGLLVFECDRDGCSAFIYRHRWRLAAKEPLWTSKIDRAGQHP